MATLLAWTLLIAAAASGSVGGVELSMKPLGDLFYKPLGYAVVFTCQLKRGADDDYIDDESNSRTSTGEQLEWFDTAGNVIRDRTGRRYVEEEEDSVKKLYITNIEQGDEGVYKCSITLNGVKTEKTVTLKLFKAIAFESAVSPQYPRLLSDAVIKCVVSGQPVPEISWRYKGQRVIMSGSRYSKVPDGLQINNITLNDDGEYTCRAEVEVDGRYDERRIIVAVHIPPAMTEAPSNVEGIEGEEVTMSCKASGMPSPKYDFYKDGAAVMNTSRITVDPVAGSIHFKPVAKSDEDVRYNCTASNDVGSASAAAQLRVLVRPTISEFNDIKGHELSLVKFVCVATGDPTPNMTFQRVGKPTVYHIGRNEDGRIRAHHAGLGRLELRIDMLEPTDAGEYRCNAVSDIGKHNDTASLTVEYKPRFASNHSVVEHSWAGKQRNITCHVEAEPAAVIEWKKDGKTLQNNASYSIFSSGSGGGRASALQVAVREMDQGWIYGVYTCYAQNEHGNRDIDIELKHASVPDEPRAINATERTPNSIVIQIEPPEEDGGMPILGYRLEYNDVTFDISAVTADSTGPPYDTSSTSATDAEGNVVRIDNLKPSTTYVLIVRAKNEVGVGSPRRFEVTTEAIRKPYPLEITSPKSGVQWTSYRITWSKPNTGGRPIREYEFRYKEVTLTGGVPKPVDPQQTWTSKQREDKPALPMRDFQLEGLAPNSHYQLQIRARNDIGWSEYTEDFVFRTAPATEAELAALRRSSLGSASVIVIVVVIALLVLVITDLSCCYVNHCGITMLVCRRLCPDRTPHKYSVKEKELEAGERQHLKAIADEGKDVDAKDSAAGGQPAARVMEAGNNSEAPNSKKNDAAGNKASAVVS